MIHPIDFPDAITAHELVNLITEVEKLPADPAQRAARLAEYDAILERAPRWRIVRSKDAGQKGDVCVRRGHRMAWYRPVTAEVHGPEVMPVAAIRRAFSEGMQRAMWGCVA